MSFGDELGERSEQDCETSESQAVECDAVPVVEFYKNGENKKQLLPTRFIRPLQVPPPVPVSSLKQEGN